LTKKKAIVSVISDLVSDQRVHRICSFLEEEGYEVELVGRESSKTQLNKRSYNAERLPMWFSKGVLSYSEFNARLFFRLLFSGADIFVANDLDTLLPNYFISKIKKKKLFYDSHEYFTGVPELEHNTLKRKAWQRLEKFLLPKLKDLYTVNESIAGKYKEVYGVDMKVVRNLPVYEPTTPSNDRLYPEGKKILLLQGAGINIQRGAEELVESMRFLPDDFMLYLIGSGDCWEQLKQLAVNLQLQHKVKFIEKIPFQELKKYTAQADLGFSLDKPINLNYQLSLPNKIFDYIHAGVPVLASDIFEVKKVIETWDVGTIINEVTPEAIAVAVKEIFNDESRYFKWKENTLKAARELNWQKEKLILKQIYHSA
jgi:glycosyltransferase involved in cell wall biosynthesis